MESSQSGLVYQMKIDSCLIKLEFRSPRTLSLHFRKGYVGEMQESLGVR